MAAPGHLLRPRHLIPVVFAIWYQFLRFLLRVRWWGRDVVTWCRDAISWCRDALPRIRDLAIAGSLHVWEFVQRPVRVTPTWTLGAIAGTLGVMLTVLLFLFPGEQPGGCPNPGRRRAGRTAANSGRGRAAHTGTDSRTEDRRDLPADARPGAGTGARTGTDPHADCDAAH